MTILKKGNDEAVEEGVKGINRVNRKKHKISKGNWKQLATNQKAKKMQELRKLKLLEKPKKYQRKSY